jgi:adenosylcobinamide-GDP ribazoletransferase
MTPTEYAISFVFAIAALFWLPEKIYLFAAVLPIVVWFILTTMMKRKINGYTGDCCGALFLLCELSFYLGIAIIQFKFI